MLINSGTSLSGLTQYPTIASTVRANPSAGFSIVKWTNPSSSGTVGHGLNAAPALILTKGLGSSEWQVYHKELGNAYKLYLNGGDAQVSSSVWSTTTPTSSVFNFNDNRTQDFIAYCFAPVEGYSKFGKYTGNGSSTDGTFVYTGFRPKWLLLKHTTDAYHWYLFDTSRDTDNVVGTALVPNESYTETSDPTNYGVDFLSNGFKLRNSNARSNANGVTYIYACFAEHPQKHSRAR